MNGRMKIQQEGRRKVLVAKWYLEEARELGQALIDIGCSTGDRGFAEDGTEMFTLADRELEPEAYSQVSATKEDS